MINSHVDTCFVFMETPFYFEAKPESSLSKTESPLSKIESPLSKSERHNNKNQIYLSTQHKGVRANTGGLKIKIMWSNMSVPGLLFQ